MRRLLARLLFLTAAAVAPLQAQEAAQAPPPPIDSLTVEGNARVSAQQVIAASGLLPQQRPSYRDIQRAIAGVYRTGQFDDVRVDQRQSANGKFVLVLVVRERPLQGPWSVIGPEKIAAGDVRERIRVIENRPVDRAAIAHSAYAIDSLYRDRGFFASSVTVQSDTLPDGRLGTTFVVNEGDRVAIAKVTIAGQQRYDAGEIVDHMATRPEGFWWWQKGDYDEEELEGDLRERLPAWYATQGFIDFQVLADTLVPDSTRGKAELRLTVDEGPQYMVGTFDLAGNRRYSTEELLAFFPYGAVNPGGAPFAKVPFDRSKWEKATGDVQSLYANNGYIYAQVVPEEVRRTTPEGEHFVDLRWNIREGQVATVNRILIVGNDVTHEGVIRDAIVMLPGTVFSRDLLMRSWQNIGNLGFFQQPLPAPDVQPSDNRVDVDITFRVEERRTGNINFGASLGQGTGIGGFLGLEEPNLFGQGKRGRLQWQFGRNIRDFTLQYTDPNIRGSRISGTVSVFDSRARFVVGDLGRRQQTGFNLQAGFPFLATRYTRLFLTYGLQRITYRGGSEDLRLRFQCEECTRSTLGASVLKDTRVGLPFPTGGTLVNFQTEVNGGVLGGTGNYQKFEVDGKWFTPLGVIGGSQQQMGSGVQLVLGFTARTGVIFGDAGPFFTELYSMGGVQFGIPLRGYPEFSITPDGFDARAQSNVASPNAFGQSYAAFNVELGARVSQFLYVSTFVDAGNVYRSAAQYNPTRLFRGAGAGVAVVSPLGPIGVDMAYGFDRTDLVGRPKPGWQLHFRLGNFF